MERFQAGLNSAIYASAFGRSGSMVIFGGGHNDYSGSDVHALDLARREWRRLTTGFISGQPEEYGQGAVYPDAVYPDGSPLPPLTYHYIQYSAMQMLPIADMILISLQARDIIGSIHLRYPADPISPVKSIGNRPTLHEYAALEYTPRHGSLVYYSAVDGANIFAIDWGGEARWRVLSSPESLNPIVEAASQSSYRVNQTHTLRCCFQSETVINVGGSAVMNSGAEMTALGR